MSSVDRQALLGAWKLISIQLKMSDTGEIVDLYGPEPVGACLFDPSGRLMVVITPSGPRESPGFVGGYSGKFCLDGDTLVTRFDVAIHPSQDGTEQRRSVDLQGDILTLTSPEQAFGQYDGRVAVGTVVWQREVP
jgi:hypothetical protein